MFSDAPMTESFICHLAEGGHSPAPLPAWICQGIIGDTHMNLGSINPLINSSKLSTRTYW